MSQVAPIEVKELNSEYKLSDKQKAFLLQSEEGQYAEVLSYDSAGGLVLSLEEGMSVVVSMVTREGVSAQQIELDVTQKFTQGDRIYFDADGKAVRAALYSKPAAVSKKQLKAGSSHKLNLAALDERL